MSVDPERLAQRIAIEVGLDFEANQGRDIDGRRWIEIHPSDHPKANTFVIRTTIGWRRLDVNFQPGTFAAELIQAMSSADDVSRTTFAAILEKCSDDGADIELLVNGNKHFAGDIATWSTPWRSVNLAVRRGMLQINDGDEATDRALIELWTARVAAAVVALLPLEIDIDDDVDAAALGLPEGAKTRIEVNRYERDRRNRAAALAIHGYSCMACDTHLEERYGEAAVGLIEVHHLTPVSLLGEGYVINPKVDLAPLCPNCHAVAHRRMPPFSIQELRSMLGHDSQADIVASRISSS
jgi:5-methylcytosine-specific restriction protein A